LPDRTVNQSQGLRGLGVRNCGLYFDAESTKLYTEEVMSNMHICTCTNEGKFR